MTNLNTDAILDHIESNKTHTTENPTAVIEAACKGNIKRLRKMARYEFDERYELHEDDLTANTHEQFRTFKEVYNIEDAYNNYFVDSYGNKIQPSDLVDNTNMIVMRKSGPKLERLSTKTKAGCQVLADLLVYMQYLKARSSKTPDEDRQQYIHFDYTSNVDVTETEIYKRFNAIWSEWGLIDVVNQKPIIDAMCKIIGFIFTSNRAWRYFMVLESTCSGWGKTAFINAICNNTDLYTHYIPHQNDTDKYSYSEMYKGKDVSVIDDPGKNMHVLAGEINNVVSTKRGFVREMNTMGYTADGVETRIVVTTNIPFRVSQDLMLDNKMICVKTNSIEGRNKDEQEIICNLTNKYINQAPKELIDRFVSGCVDLLAKDTNWINTHLGLHTDEEELGCKIAQLIPLEKENDTFKFGLTAKSLEDLINPELKLYDASDIANESRYAGFKFAYIDICKELKTKCYEDRCQYTGSLKFMSGRQSKERCRNFKLTDRVKAIIISALLKCEYEGTQPYSVVNDVVY